MGERPPLGPLVLLHQAWEGETTCLWCGAAFDPDDRPMPAEPYKLTPCPKHPPGAAIHGIDGWTLAVWPVASGSMGAILRRWRPELSVTTHYPPGELAAWVACRLTKAGVPWLHILSLVEHTIDVVLLNLRAEVSPV